MQETIVVTPGSAADLNDFAGHWLAMFEEVGNYSESDFPPDWRDGFRSYFERRMAAGEAALFVAREGAAIVATAGALVRDGYPSAVTAIKHGYIFGVRVAPGYRRRGLAERLTREAVRYLRAQRCRTIRLHASRFGRAMYERIGFVPTNELELPG
jgi:ribosomal protein S18 acetylase RimI-like enzyme